MMEEILIKSKKETQHKPCSFLLKNKEDDGLAQEAKVIVFHETHKVSSRLYTLFYPHFSRKSIVFLVNSLKDLVLSEINPYICNLNSSKNTIL